MVTTLARIGTFAKHLYYKLIIRLSESKEAKRRKSRHIALGIYRFWMVVGKMIPEIVAFRSLGNSTSVGDC